MTRAVCRVVRVTEPLLSSPLCSCHVRQHQLPSPLLAPVSLLCRLFWPSVTWWARPGARSAWRQNRSRVLCATAARGDSVPARHCRLPAEWRNVQSWERAEPASTDTLSHWTQDTVKISCDVSSDDPQLYPSWSQLEMASVLSGWLVPGYNGYNIHNIFNVANFIEYEHHPKRRKLDKSNNYLTSEPLSADYEATATTRARKQHVSYRPYSDLTRDLGSQANKQKQTKKIAHKADLQVTNRTHQEDVAREGTTSDVLFPEILCLIFEKLDLQSKGRVAQVSICNYLLRDGDTYCLLRTSNGITHFLNSIHS